MNEQRHIEQIGVNASVKYVKILSNDLKMF